MNISKLTFAYPPSRARRIHGFLEPDPLNKNFLDGSEARSESRLDPISMSTSLNSNCTFRALSKFFYLKSDSCSENTIYFSYSHVQRVVYSELKTF